MVCLCLSCVVVFVTKIVVFLTFWGCVVVFWGWVFGLVHLGGVWVFGFLLVGACFLWLCGAVRLSEGFLWVLGYGWWFICFGGFCEASNALLFLWWVVFSFSVWLWGVVF